MDTSHHPHRKTTDGSNVYHEIRLEGFTLLERANSCEAADIHLASTFQMVKDCRFAERSFTEILNVQGRRGCNGHDRITNGDCRFEELLAGS